MAGTSSSIQALSKENYDTWKIQMEALLIQKKLWRFADGTSIKPAEASGNEEAIAKKRDVRWQRASANTTEDFYIAAQNEEEANQIQDEPKLKWCLDSGCTTHMCGDERILENKVTCNSVLKLATDAATTAKVKGVAKVAVSGGRIQLAKLHDTLYVPNLRTNLMSVSKITEKGKTMIFDSKQAIVKDADGNTVMTAD
ncbi:uncharacterized protein LOC130671170 [Microplitis mediator]|uniref:uncharacterized protein LOC130671170 n=1 Tax=Microplitis mediator TaxID=375433 RepID=UPI002554DAC0|nr:uncharacterized protein LOC130671170 [Microplitis mediator]